MFLIQNFSLNWPTKNAPLYRQYGNYQQKLNNKQNLKALTSKKAIDKVIETTNKKLLLVVSMTLSIVFWKWELLIFVYFWVCVGNCHIDDRGVQFFWVNL